MKVKRSEIQFAAPAIRQQYLKKDIEAIKAQDGVVDIAQVRLAYTGNGLPAPENGGHVVVQAIIGVQENGLLLDSADSLIALPCPPYCKDDKSGGILNFDEARNLEL